MPQPCDEKATKEIIKKAIIQHFYNYEALNYIETTGNPSMCINTTYMLAKKDYEKIVGDVLVDIIYEELKGIQNDQTNHN